MITRIQIDFAKPAWYSVKYVTPLGAILMLLSIIFCVSVYGYTLIQERSQLAISQREIPKAQPAKVVAKPTVLPMFNEVQTQILTSIVAQLNAPWNDLLTALETMKTPDISLTSILPNHQKQQLELNGEARNIPAMLSYVESLEALAMLDHVTLQKHQINEAHPYQPVEFVIMARWR